MQTKHFKAEAGASKAAKIHSILKSYRMLAEAMKYWFIALYNPKAKCTAVCKHKFIAEGGANGFM